MHSTWCQKSGFIGCQSRQGRRCTLNVRLTDIFSNSPHVFVSPRKTNYALFPLIKLLISAGWFRNMKQNSEQIKCRATSCFSAAQRLCFNRESFVHCVSPHGPLLSLSLETKLLLTEKVIKNIFKNELRLDGKWSPFYFFIKKIQPYKAYLNTSHFIFPPHNKTHHPHTPFK